MNLIYEIIERDLTEHTMVVRYTTDRLPAQLLDPQLEADGSIKLREDGKVARCRGDFNMMVPVPEPDAATLHAYIVARAPIDWLRTREAVLDEGTDTSMPTVQSLMGQPVTVVV